MIRVLRALSLILIFFFATHQGFALSYSGKLVVDGKVFDGEADFHFSILDVNNTQLWQSGLINGKTVPLGVNKGRYSIELGGELTRPLSNSVFLFGPSLKLRVLVDLRDGKGLQSAGADISIQSVALARYAQRAKQAKSAMIADSVLNGSVTDSTLSPELRETLALANDPERLKPENLSSSLRQYFANDLKPKFSELSTKAFEHGYSEDLFNGLVGLYSALSVKENLQIGDVVDQWHDLSGQGHSFDNFSGGPKYVISKLGEIPVIAFSGNDLLWTSHNFDHLTTTGYTIISLSRNTGYKDGRVISSRNRNFLFGYHWGKVDSWYAEGWIYPSSRIDNLWHIHVGTIEAIGGDPAASFWLDGNLLVSNNKGSHNTNFGPGQLQLGGWKTNTEMSTCEVAEIMIFDRQISENERLKLEGSLAHKWGIESEVLKANHPYYDYNPYGASQSVTLKAPAITGKNITYIWNKNGELIDGAVSTSLSVSTNESAEYSVIAGNLFGTDQHTFSVTATPSPAAPENNDTPKPDVSHLINRKVVASWNNTFYIDENGSLWGVGANWWGSLGIGDGNSRSKFEKVVSGQVVSVGTRDNHSYFIKEDGSLWGMGYNNNGQLGIGFFGGSRSTPVEIVDRGVIDLAVGSEHTLFLKHDGSLWGMGRNVEGQLGIGNNDRQSSPILIIDANVTEIACGYRSSYALKKDGSLWSWGHNAHGRLGDGTASNRNLPVKVVDSNVSTISCVADHVLFLKKDGSAWAFGNNWNSRIGDGTWAHRSIPVKIIDDNVTACFAGSRNSYFLRENRALWGVGVSKYGALGTDTKNDYNQPVLIADNVDRAFSGNNRLLYTQFDDRLMGVGDCTSFQFGQAGEVYHYQPIEIMDSNVSAVTSGDQHSVMLKSDGSVWTMGRGFEGRLGNGGPDRWESEPQKIVDENVTHISSHFRHTLIIKNDGSLWAFGANWNGQLGDGSKSHRNVPKKIVDSNVTACAAGERHSLFVKNDGSLWAMGQNHKGQLGDGTNTDRTSPVKIVDQNVTAVSAGQNYSLFLKNDGSVWSMGFNDHSRLGIGTNGDRNVPTLVMASGAVAIESGIAHSLILKSDGSLWAFGIQDSGRLGVPRYGHRNNPSMVVESGVVDISAGGNHSLFVKNDGSVWGMGHNGYGQLGMEKSGDNNWPIRILESGASSVEACRNSFSFVVMKDGSLLGFGRDEDAQLGTGRMIRTHIPVTVAERIAE